MSEPAIPKSGALGQPDPLADDPKLRELIENYKRASEALTAHLHERARNRGCTLG